MFLLSVLLLKPVRPFNTAETLTTNTPTASGNDTDSAAGDEDDADDGNNEE